MARISNIQIRRGTAAAWASANPTLAAGEQAYESDTGTLKIGDGTTAYNTLVPVASRRSDMPIGIEWETGSNSPTLRIIDINKNTIPQSTSVFDNHKIWGGIRRCTRNRSTGVITYGSDNKGTGLTLDGSAGDVLVEIPTAKYKYEVDGTKRRYWLIPYTTEDTKYTIHPSAVQRSATGTARSKIYVGAYEAGLMLSAAGAIQLKSVTGVQPFTGTEGMYSIAFTSGSTAPVVNETLTGATSGATGIVVDFHLASGTWAGGDAAGVLYIKQKSVTAFVAEDLNGATAGANCATVGGAAAGISLTLDQAEGYAGAKGTGFGICNAWTYAYIQLLIYIETGTLDSQTALEKGIVDLAAGTGYAGKITGADSIDSRLGTNGTGVGSGTNGQTPIAWRGLENLYGNCWEFMAGLNMNLSDGTYNILKRDGTGTPAATLAGGSYETGVGTVPIAADGYISGIQSDELGALSFIPSADAGTSSYYLCDMFYYPRYSPSCVLFGGSWSYGLAAGVGCRTASYDPSGSGRTVGARLEFLP